MEGGEYGMGACVERECASPSPSIADGESEREGQGMCVEEMAFCRCLIFLCLHREHTIQVPTLIHTYLLHAFRRCLILLFLDHEHAGRLALVPLEQCTSAWGT